MSIQEYRYHGPSTQSTDIIALDYCYDHITRHPLQPYVRVAKALNDALEARTSEASAAVTGHLLRQRNTESLTFLALDIEALKQVHDELV